MYRVVKASGKWRAPGADLMSAYEPQMGTRSEDIGKTAHSSCARNNSFSRKFSKINTYGNKLKLKNDNCFRLMFETHKSASSKHGVFSNFVQT